MARRDHHAEVGLEVADQEGETRCRDDSSVENVNTRTGKSSRHRSAEELPGDTGITPHDGDRPSTRGATTICHATLAENDSCRLGETESKVDGEVGVRESANTVRTKEPRHVVRTATRA